MSWLEFIGRLEQDKRIVLTVKLDDEFLPEVLSVTLAQWDRLRALSERMDFVDVKPAEGE